MKRNDYEKWKTLGNIKIMTNTTKNAIRIVEKVKYMRTVGKDLNI